MAWPAVAYADYTANGGTASESDFGAMLSAATWEVEHACWPNIPADDDTDAQGAATRAICAVIDVDMAYGGTHGVGLGSGSVSIGSLSMTATAADYRFDVESAIRRNLSITGLMCRVIS